jgi:hypothetical protein
VYIFMKNSSKSLLKYILIPMWSILGISLLAAYCGEKHRHHTYRYGDLSKDILINDSRGKVILYLKEKDGKYIPTDYKMKEDHFNLLDPLNSLNVFPAPYNPYAIPSNN